MWINFGFEYSTSQRNGRNHPPCAALLRASIGLQPPAFYSTRSIRWLILYRETEIQSATMHPTEESFLPQFCVIEYNHQRQSREPSRSPSIILLVLKNENGNLDFLVHPQWRAMILPEDSEYFESLLADLPVRAKLHSEALFDQMCSLSVGPLQTKETGPRISRNPGLAKLISTFEPV